ncbi:hypothetical protein CAPTEDRAFT_214744 [Capitella teleta]|uniref:Uncharacterized protein n=1 Tax=Capitella teleta TaxID=283909 RepID=R7UHM4_CAPTE|nr:hypothetical protein CAPTEDRAFT_214744 [Capitella teleta]|eukprot:ELU03313.1 hypothetical protein CAPTEDRAFT_214744 [Capitella teleta]
MVRRRMLRRDLVMRRSLYMKLRREERREWRNIRQYWKQNRRHRPYLKRIRSSDLLASTLGSDPHAETNTEFVKVMGKSLSTTDYKSKGHLIKWQAECSHGPKIPYLGMPFMEILAGLGEEPSPLNRKFFPKDDNIRNIVYSFRKKRLSGLYDQDLMESIIRLMDAEPIHFRPYEENGEGIQFQCEDQVAFDKNDGIM